MTSRHNGQETAASAAARSKLAILRLNASGNKAVELEREILQAGTSRPLQWECQQPSLNTLCLSGFHVRDKSVDLYSQLDCLTLTKSLVPSV